jgi:hypothetical protein
LPLHNLIRPVGVWVGWADDDNDDDKNKNKNKTSAHNE